MALVGFRDKAHLTAFEASLPPAWTSLPRPVTDFLRPYTYTSNKDLFLDNPEAFGKCDCGPPQHCTLAAPHYVTHACAGARTVRTRRWSWALRRRRRTAA